MEIEIDKILRTIDSVEGHPELKTLLDGINDNFVNDSICGKYAGTLHHEVYRIGAEIKSRLTASDLSISAAAHQQLAQVVALTNYYFKKAFEEKDQLSLFRFIIANSCFEYLVSKFLAVNSITSENLNIVINRICAIVNQINSDINVPANTPYHEKKWLKDFNEGFAENDLGKVYNFVRAVEMGRGFYIGSLYEALLILLFDLDQSKFHDCLSKKEKVADFIISLQELGRENLINLAANFEFKNKWLIFELIRQIISKEKSDPVSNDGEKAIKKLLLELWKLDASFCKNVINHLNNSLALHAASGYFLAELNIADRRQIVDSCFKFENTGQNTELKYRMLNNFNDVVNEEDAKLHIQYVFNKWEEYQKTLELDSEFLAFKIIANDFCYYIIAYYRLFFSLKQIGDEINKTLHKIRYQESNWYRNESNYTAVFFIYLSHLFILSHAYKEDAKELKQNIDFPDINIILKNPVMTQRFLRKDGKKEIDEIYSYLTTKY